MGNYLITRTVFQRGLAGIYFISFFSSARQFKALIGEEGLLPISIFLNKIHFWDSPSLFWLNATDVFVGSVLWCGVGLSLFAASGLSEKFGPLLSAVVWSLLWVFYLSVVNVGQVFYGFGWEIMTLEAGFLALFLSSEKTSSPAVVFWTLRWLLFRLMFGAGLIKLRGDACWRDLSCMIYHYETQPIPNPLSWYFHGLPEGFLKFQTLYTHFVELIVPWLYFTRGRWAHLAGVLTIMFQICLILSGNLSWLNYLTIVIAFSCLEDPFWTKYFKLRPPSKNTMSRPRVVLLWAFSGAILFLSAQPFLNLFSSRQIMNGSFEPFHLVNSYGAFGSVTRHRDEIVFEGTSNEILSEDTQWKEYEFKAKPGDVTRRPAIVAPYHLRLDWLMWFAAMSDWQHYPWLLNFAGGLLKNDPVLLDQIRFNPFPENPPRYVRALLYRYTFTTPSQRKESGAWWSRRLVRIYLPVLGKR